MRAKSTSLVVGFLIPIIVTGPVPCSRVFATIEYQNGDDGFLMSLGCGRLYGINEAGETVGYRLENQQIVWEHWDLDGKGDDVVTEAQLDSHGYAINDYGDTVGWAETTQGGPRHPFVWSSSGGLEDLAEPSDVNEGCAIAINNNGMIVGWMAGRAVCWGNYWDAGGYTYLGTLGGLTGQAYGINAAGHIVGWSETASRAIRATWWQEDGGMWPGTDLGVPGDDADSIAYAINRSGIIAGCWGQIAEGEDLFDEVNVAECFPCRYDVINLGDSTIVNVTELPMAGGTNGCAYGINNAGEIVGCCIIGGEQHAFLWDRNGNAVDLNEQFASLSDWTLNVANGINLLGTIGGWGTVNGEERALLLVPKRLWRTASYRNPDGTGQPSIYSGNYDLLEETLSGPEPRKVYCASGFDTADGHRVKLYYQPIAVGETTEMIVERYEYASENPTVKATAIYNENGQITQIEQVNQDSNEPNDIFVFGYDEQGRLTSVARSVEDVNKSMVELSDYCDYCSQALRKRAGRIRYSHVADPNRTVEIRAGYDMQGHLTSLNTTRNGFGQLFTFGYDPNGRTTIVNYVEDKDGNGSYETPVLNGICTYDTNDRLVQIHDTISDSNIVQWIHEPNYETIVIRPVLGDANTVTLKTTATDVANGQTITTELNGSEYGTVAIYEDDLGTGWWGHCNGWNFPGPVDYAWGKLHSEPADPNSLRDRLLVPLVNDSNQLAASIAANGITVNCFSGDFPVFGYKVYRNRQDVRCAGMRKHIGAVYGRLHVKGKILAGGGSENILSALFVDVRGKILVHSNSELLDKHMDNNTSLQIRQESYPEGLNIIPVYSTTGNGTPYIAGAVTPDGVYSYFQYNADGLVEATVRMNDIAGMGCTQQVKGDINDDCRVNFCALAIMAANWLVDRSVYPDKSVCEPDCAGP